MRNALITAGLLASTASMAITKSDRNVINEYLDLPSTQQLIQVDESLKSLSVEELHQKVVDEGTLDDIKAKMGAKEYIKKHPEYQSLIEFHGGEDKIPEVLPELRYMDLDNPRVIPYMPWDGDQFGYADLAPQGMFSNQLSTGATCVAKIRGNVGWFKAGPHSINPWDKIFPLMDCVTHTKRRGIDPHKCYIATCSPASANIVSALVDKLVEDIIMGKYN